MIPRPPGSPLLPYTTLFRSAGLDRLRVRLRQPGQRHAGVAADDEHVVPGELVVHGRAPPAAPDEPERAEQLPAHPDLRPLLRDRKSTRLNSSHANISYAVFC